MTTYRNQVGYFARFGRHDVRIRAANMPAIHERTGRRGVGRDRGPRAVRGFTLVELLAVVAMIGILSALAILGYRKYLNASRSSDAKAIIGAIRIAEESYRSETLVYLGCSGTLTTYYPAATPNKNKRHWVQPTHGDWSCWSTLNVSTDSPTMYVFAVVAGAPGSPPPPPNTLKKPTWPNPTAEPWYVIQAAGDVDGDTKQSLFLSSSFTGEIYAENEGE